MRGRRPAGREYVDQLDGTAQDKERLQAILETLGGQARLVEACDRVAVGESRFRQLREAALQGALDAIAPRPAGRPRQACSSEAERIREFGSGPGGERSGAARGPGACGSGPGAAARGGWRSRAG